MTATQSQKYNPNFQTCIVSFVSLLFLLFLSYETSLHFLCCPLCTLCLDAFPKTFLIFSPLHDAIFISY